MVKQIVRDVFFLGQPSEPATKADIQVGKDNVMEKGDNLAWHMIISFKPGEITDPHIAHEVATTYDVSHMTKTGLSIS